MAKAKRKGSKRSGGGRAPSKADALKLLKQDHDKVKKAFKQFEKMDHEDPAAHELAAQTIADLKLHAAVEEEVFYPAVRMALDEDDLMNEAEVEHKSAKLLIKDLESMKPGDPLFAATFTVLGEYVQHHAEEEEGEMFPKARKAKLDLAALGEQIAARKAAQGG
jgi:hemerythrin superfamily protein